MTWLLGTPSPGDWVTATRHIRVTLTDHLIGGDAGIAPGTAGVVTRAVGWNSLEVRFDTGLLGPVTARVRPAEVRVARRGGGVDAFARRSARLNAVRAGVALAFLAPPGYFVVAWFLQGGTKEGLLVALVESAIYGALELVAYAMANPVNALLYVVMVSGAARFAFP